MKLPRRAGFRLHLDGMHNTAIGKALSLTQAPLQDRTASWGLVQLLRSHSSYPRTIGRDRATFLRAVSAGCVPSTVRQEQDGDDSPRSLLKFSAATLTPANSGLLPVVHTVINTLGHSPWGQDRPGRQQKKPGKEAGPTPLAYEYVEVQNPVFHRPTQWRALPPVG